MTRPRVLIACIGNIFLGDDGFGVEVARRLANRRLAGRTLPDDVRVVDFGIRGLDLVYALLDGYETAILVDATPRGGEPGTLYLIEPDAGDPAGGGGAAAVEAHGMDPLAVLRLVSSMGGEHGRVLIVGCEPETFGPEEGAMGLSERVEASVDEAVRMVEELVAETCNWPRDGSRDGTRADSAR